MIPEAELEPSGGAMANVRWDDLAGGVVRRRGSLDCVFHRTVGAFDLVSQHCRVLGFMEYERKAVFELPGVRPARMQHGSIVGTPFKRDWIMGRDTEGGVTDDSRQMTGAF
jgi:hypothetical protein